MSARRLSVRLTPEARADLRQILLYTLHAWGAAQRDTYRAAIKGALDTLRRYPMAGRARDDLRPGRRTFQVRHHVVVYRLDGDRVVVLRILHERMDIESIIAKQGDEPPP